MPIKNTIIVKLNLPVAAVDHLLILPDSSNKNFFALIIKNAPTHISQDQNGAWVPVSFPNRMHVHCIQTIAESQRSALFEHKKMITNQRNGSTSCS